MSTKESTPQGAELKHRRQEPIPDQGRWLASIVRVHCAYYRVRQQERGRRPFVVRQFRSRDLY